jgi:hypothetical protein
MTHIYIVLLCGSAITKLAEKRQNNCGKEKKKWKHPAYLRKERTQLLKRENMWNDVLICGKGTKQLRKREKKCGNVVLICGKGTTQLRKREKNVETSFSIFFLLFPHFTTDCEKIVLLTSEFNCSRHLIGQFLFCRDYFLSNCD